MNKPTYQSNRLSAEDHAAIQAAETEDARYDVFGEWLDAELEKLVSRWIHLAAPNASSARKLKPR
jgi:hypothetical protein